jgi:hypothetical protein
MTIYTNIGVGVSISLCLKYQNIELIHKLFNNDELKRFVYGLDNRDFSKYINYNHQYDDDEEKGNFDECILEYLIGLKDEEEFKIRAKNVAELGIISNAYSGINKFSLRRTKDYNDNYDEENDEDDEDIKYNIFDMNKHEIKFVFYYQCFNVSSEFSSENFQCNYSSIGYKPKQLLNEIQKGIDFFTSLGIDEEKIEVSQYDYGISQKY